MAHHKSAIRRIRKSLEQNKRNRHYRSMMQTMMKKVLQTEEKEAAAKLLPEAMGLLDRLASKKIIHKNNAANKKSRLSRHVNALS